ncbi:MAG: carboxypeptidase regulatory-like domain-containing protein [Brevundimonas sp.]|nr:MAG: carboxypeptidase regulatory-like domain-containing protein [Brevundimonas sp.]
MSPPWILACVLTVAVLGAWIRLALWRRAAADRRGASWRFAVLVALQPVCAALLFFGLFPPDRPAPASAIMVATAGAPASLSGDGARLYALPEAPPIPGAERAPDLGTVLRRHPGVRRIAVVGAGLTARDREALGDVAMTFRPSAGPKGLVTLNGPDRVAPGAAFIAGGQVDGVAGGRAELLDPAGRVTDAQPLAADGGFALNGSTRAAGLTAFEVRIKDARDQVIETAALPVRVEPTARPRLLILAAAPSAEVKYLRRWATDAGFDVVAQISIGGGVEVGDPQARMDAAALGRFDAAVIDDRSWRALGGGRSAVLAAVRSGMGLVLRPTGPLDAGSAGDWRALGFSLSGQGGLTSLALPAARGEAAQRTRLGIPPADQSLDAGFGEAVAPDLQRLGLIPGGGETAPVLRDAKGTTLAAWRAFGRGRIAVFTPVDSYALTLTGRRDLYAEWWSDLLSTTARPGPASPAMPGKAWEGERTVVCGLKSGAKAESASLIVDPAGCAAFWPARAGWMSIDSGDGAMTPLFVHGADSLSALRTRRDRDATLMLPKTAPGAPPAERAPGSPLPLMAAWFVASVALWAFERSRLGRRRDTAPPPLV